MADRCRVTQDLREDGARFSVIYDPPGIEPKRGYVNDGPPLTTAEPDVLPPRLGEESKSPLAGSWGRRE